MGFFGSMSAGFEQGRIKARHEKERQNREEARQQQKARQEAWNNPSTLAQKIGSAYEKARPIGRGAMKVGTGLAKAVIGKPKPAPKPRKKTTTTKRKTTKRKTKKPEGEYRAW